VVKAERKVVARVWRADSEDMFVVLRGD
jgi:hypothetical protein